MQAKTIRFIRRGEIVALGNVPPDRTLLELLREDLGATGTKEGCGEGDCGACTVVLGEAEGNGIRYRAVNSCIRLAHSIDGLALWTVEDLAGADGGLHPAQQAMVDCHGSQCGFCTPGFVMSLFGMYQNHVCRGREVDRELAQVELSGNLCRCTGYRPILDAAQAMEELPSVKVDERELAARLSELAGESPSTSSGRTALEGDWKGVEQTAFESERRGVGQPEIDGHPKTPVRAEPVEAPANSAGYLLPKTLAELIELRARLPQAQLIAGCTDAGLWITKQHRRFDTLLDVTRVAELRRIDSRKDALSIGAAVPLADAFDALVTQRPQLKHFAQRFAGLPIRHSGTLGGNIANGSPIGDSMPLLISLGANLVLASQRRERTLAIEDFYTGYRQTVLAADEVLVRVEVPAPVEGEFMRVYKISKRFDDDISAVCLALSLRLKAGRVESVHIGAGGIAASPVRARHTESVLTGQAWSENLAQAAADSLRTEFSPISDMRASAGYRLQVLGNLVRRFWLESQGMTGINLENFQSVADEAVA